MGNLVELEYITDVLRGFYPNTTLLTPHILAEMADKCRKLGWSIDTFDRALRIYRDDPLRVEKKEDRVPPTWRQLVGYINRSEPVSIPCRQQNNLPELLVAIGIKEVRYRMSRGKQQVRDFLEKQIIELRNECIRKNIPLRSWLGDLPLEEKPSYLKPQTEEVPFWSSPQ